MGDLTRERDIPLAQDFERLVKICESTCWKPEYEDIFTQMAKALTVELKAEYVNIYLFDFNENSMTTYASYSLVEGVETPDKRGITHKRSSLGRLPWAVEKRECIIMDYAHPHPADESVKEGLEMGFCGAVTVPLVAVDEVLGIYNLCYMQARTWSREELEYLKVIGRLLGLTIQRAQMSRKFAEMLILNERKFLSSEIHDNLAQTVSSLKLGVDTALMLCEEHKYDELGKELTRLSNSGKQAVALLREEMLTLRYPISDTGGGLAPSVCDSLESFNSRWLIETELIIEGENEPAVSVQIELQMMRILHEVLSNVLRHAQARKVEVHLLQIERRLQMRISDDGRGFEVESVPAERLGLRIMKERAEQMGGCLQVVSRPGNGTTVIVEMPSIF